MLVVSNTLGGLPLLHVVGEVDHGNVSILAQAVDAALGGHPDHILIDLESCPYIDSGGVSQLIETLRKVRAAGGWLGIIAPHPDVLRILTLVGLAVDAHIRIFNQADEAVIAAQELGLESGRQSVTGGH